MIMQLKFSTPTIVIKGPLNNLETSSISIKLTSLKSFFKIILVLSNKEASLVQLNLAMAIEN